MGTDLRCKHDASLLVEAARLHDAGLGRRAIAARLGVPHEAVRKWLVKYRAGGDGAAPQDGRETDEIRLRDKGRRGERRGRRRDGQARGDEALRDSEHEAARALVPALPRGRGRGAEAQAEGPAEGPGRKSRAQDPRGGARGARPQARGPGGVPKKIDSPEGGAALPNREKALAVAELSGQGHDLAHLLAAARLARSTYYYALAHPKAPTRPELRARVAEIFGRLPNGVGHRQVAMELRAADGARIADKTVLKMMNEMGLRCGIRRETDYHRYNSYRGEVGETFENVIGRDFAADGPWQKMGTDVTEFKLSFGKAYLAPVYDFGSKEIVAHSISMHPDLAQQEEMLEMLLAAKPEGARPVLHSDMGWQYQHAAYVGALAENGFVQSMSRKGNCLDNGATEQVFGHLKDEFFRGRDWDTFEGFKADLESYIHHWNNVRRQVKLKGLTPVEFRERALREAA